MKVAFLLALFALAFAVVYAADADADACDPDGNGQPDCAGKNSGTHRNNWDPTHYWECQNGKAISVQCPIQTGYVAASSSCVPWSEWEWVPPCPKASPSS